MALKMRDLISEKFANSLQSEEFGQEVPKLTKEQKSGILSKISEYNKYGKALYNETDMVEIAKALSEIADGAQSVALEETGNSFDKLTVNRNMTDLKKLSEQFGKAAIEAQAFKQRMTALYEEMGHIINRYYNVNEIIDDQI